MWRDPGRAPRPARACGGGEDEELEYDVYGKFNFAHEPSSVYALGRAWATSAWGELGEDVDLTVEGELPEWLRGDYLLASASAFFFLHI